MKALFIGRFQPFHLGHLNVIEKISKQYEKIIIGIGSSQFRDNLNNPFSSEIRKKMIEKSLKTAKIYNYKIILIPDINDPPNWVNHILSIFSDFDVVITNNSFTKKLFEQNNFIVKNSQLYKKEKYSGKEIRRRIKEGYKWKDLVPKDVYNIIKNKRFKKNNFYLTIFFFLNTSIIPVVVNKEAAEIHK
jgi:nicotinamide-nucleotide adenylyltransferase